MSADQSSFPLAGLEAVANAQHQWVALALTPAPGVDAWQAVLALLSYPDVGAALAPLDCIVTLDEPLRLQEEHVTALPASRVVLRVPSAVLADAPVRKHCAKLVEQGYRII